MSDQCGNCTLKGDLVKCKETPCSHHENWYAIEQQKIIDDLRDGLMQALDWNWLDEDYPEALFDELYKKAEAKNMEI